MKKAIVFLADGFEECEGLIVVDILRRAGVETVMASAMDGLQIDSSRHIKVQADVMAAELSGKESPVRGEMLVDSPLFELDNFVISPHIAGGGTVDGLDTIGECVMNHICRLFGLKR